MPTFADLGRLLIECRVAAADGLERAARAGAGDLGRTLDALAESPPPWWDGAPPAPPGLTGYQRDLIELRVAAGELPLLRHDLARNQFLLLDPVGRGGQGEVFRARQLNPPRFVAVKTLVRDTEVSRRRFEQEARALMKVRHPAVTRFHLYERVRDPSGRLTDEYVIAMEYVEGTTIQRLVRRAGPVPWPFVVRWAGVVLGGLAALHRHGLVHRDVKPENVMVVGPEPGPGVDPADTSAKVLDFGVVGPAGGDGPARIFVGTVEYAPPEQWQAAAVPASDLYALGGTMFFALTGRPPFVLERREPLKYMAAHVREPVPDLLAINPDVPADLARLVRRMLSKDAAERGTAEELAAELGGPAPAAEPSRPAAPRPAPPPPTRAAKPAAAPARPGHPVDAALAFFERRLLPDYRRPRPGEEPGVPQRLAALVRRPAVIAAAAALLLLLILRRLV